MKQSCIVKKLKRAYTTILPLSELNDCSLVLVTTTHPTYHLLQSLCRLLKSSFLISRQMDFNALHNTVSSQNDWGTKIDADFMLQMTKWENNFFIEANRKAEFGNNRSNSIRSCPFSFHYVLSSVHAFLLKFSAVDGV